jgi:hypothetical protein
LLKDHVITKLQEADINKDIKVSDLLHFSAIKVQVKHLDHLFRIYVKSMGKDTVCRVEESKCPKKPVIEFINGIFNPPERLFLDQDKKNKDHVSSNKTENVVINGGSDTEALIGEGGLDFNAKKYS